MFLPELIAHPGLFLKSLLIFLHAGESLPQCIITCVWLVNAPCLKDLTHCVIAIVSLVFSAVMVLYGLYAARVGYKKTSVNLLHV